MIKYILRNSHAVFFGFFTAANGIEITSYSFFIGMACLIAATEVRDYAYGRGFFFNHSEQE